MKMFYNPTSSTSVRFLPDTHVNLQPITFESLNEESPYNHHLEIATLEIKKEIGLPLTVLEEFMLFKIQ
jgi:hypothetical protein